MQCDLQELNEQDLKQKICKQTQLYKKKRNPKSKKTIPNQLFLDWQK